MKIEYYFNLVMDLIMKLPEFQVIVEDTCPTRWADGSKCSFADDLCNKAFMEVSFLEDLDLI